MRMTIIFTVVVSAWMVTNLNIAEAKTKKPMGESRAYQKLESHQSGDIAKAIEQIRKEKKPSGVRALSKRIREGLSPQLLLKAIDALVAIKSNLAAKTLIDLSSHRSEAVRKKIVMSLPVMRYPKIMPVLAEMLDDPDPQVRSQAAISIGKLRPQAAMKQLISAAKRGVLEASEIVGKKVRSGRVPALIGMLDEDNISGLTPVFLELALRKDVQNKQKLAIVTRLDKMSTTGSKRLLIKLAKTLPKWNVAKLAAANVLIRDIEQKEKEKAEKKAAPKEKAKVAPKAKAAPRAKAAPKEKAKVEPKEKAKVAPKEKAKAAPKKKAKVEKKAEKKEKPKDKNGKPKDENKNKKEIIPPKTEKKEKK